MLIVIQFLNAHSRKVLTQFAEQGWRFNALRDPNDEEGKTLLIPIEQGQMGGGVVDQALAEFNVFDLFRIKREGDTYTICLSQFA